MHFENMKSNIAPFFFLEKDDNKFSPALLQFKSVIWRSFIF